MSKTKKTVNHLYHYLPLVSILVAGTLGVYYFSYDRAFQVAIVIAVANAYIVWGAIHHYLHRDFHLSVLLEYIIIALLGVVVVFSLLFTA